VPDGHERPGLAGLLADQFALLDEMRPRKPRVVEAGGVLVFTFTWPYIPVDEAVARTPLRGRLARLRGLLLEDITGYLTEIVETDRERTVTSSVPTLGDDPRLASVSFTLGARKAGYGDEAEALRNWAGQLRRQAREQRRRHRTRRQELRRIREELAQRRRPAG
jgi:hypothetical protein